MPRVLLQLDPETILPIGARVRVASRYPAKGHIRTPYYLRGKEGTVVRYFGHFRDPAQLAQGNRAATPLALYQIAFASDHVWEACPSRRGVNINILADIYENWLEDADR